LLSKKIVHTWLSGIHQTDYRSTTVIAITHDEKSNFDHSCDNNNNDALEVFLPDGKFNVTGIYWLTSHIEDGVNLNLFPSVMEFKDSLEEKKFVMESNLRRRHLSLFQKVEVGYNLEGVEKEIAKGRMSLGGHIVGLANKKENCNNNNVERRVASIDATLGPNGEKGKVSQIIAKKIGVSTATYERGRKIIEKGTEEQKSSLRRGTIGLTNVYNQIRRQEKKDLTSGQ
jgi:hypothetical protein